jgi:preprotein translocase subunit SecE
MAVTAGKRSGEQQAPEFWLLRFLRETYDELRKVVWPTPQELYRYTLVVVVTVAVIAGFIGIVDAGLAEVAKRFIYSAVTKTG